MRLARKLLLLATMALALSAAPASAVEVHAETQSNVTECGTVTLTGTHHVEGGCHVEFESTEHVTLTVYPAGLPIVVGNCNVHLEGQVGEDGAGYLTEALFSDESPPQIPGCTRTPCDETDAGDEQLAWEGQLLGSDSLEARFCLRTIASGEGGTSTRCTVHLEGIDLGGHAYEVGDHTEIFCEAGDFPFPVSINPHFVIEEGSETVEVIE